MQSSSLRNLKEKCKNIMIQESLQTASSQKSESRQELENNTFLDLFFRIDRSKIIV